MPGPAGSNVPGAHREIGTNWKGMVLSEPKKPEKANSKAGQLNTK